MMQECLIDRRYLIVLDDIWSTQHWDDIKYVFHRYVEGSRILLTTRFNEVADYACTLKGNHHVMSLLDPNESWELFCNIFPLERYRAPRFESFRSHLSNVLEKCEGLPQVIVTAAKRLSECKNNIQHELKKMEKEIELLGILDYSALALIYNQLPEYLKVCFLYLGIFPKRSEIQVKTLLRLWVAEGFVKPSRNKELEKIAYFYLKDLIDRSLVLLLFAEVTVNHNLEFLLSILPSTIWESPQLRHIELGALYTVDPPSVVKKNLQTLSWVGPTHCRKGVSVGCIVTFPERCAFPSQLKKLSLSGTNLFGRDLTVIGSLKRLEVLKMENAFHEEVWRVYEGGFYGLKYLVLKDKKLKRLEAYTDAFPCLEYLVLRCCHYLEEIPSSFGEIFCLKSIELDRCSRPSIVTSAKDIQEKLNKNFGEAK
ncbi:putative late blight resistance protein homolog R1A-10 [Ipomoea triloba]|uniref:putative late blight resistance protein homolog R1A-10 n=1 Tax=Ipomoea triloba TaxID=35885 RepID=UPI00125E2336|nr:putative late blight resistance protein homolog R1A-10 [Ipomoea triloba]